MNTCGETRSRCFLLSPPIAAPLRNRMNAGEGGEGDVLNGEHCSGAFHHVQNSPPSDRSFEKKKKRRTMNCGCGNHPAGGEGVPCQRPRPYHICLNHPLPTIRGKSKQLCVDQNKYGRGFALGLYPPSKTDSKRKKMYLHQRAISKTSNKPLRAKFYSVFVTAPAGYRLLGRAGLSDMAWIMCTE